MRHAKERHDDQRWSLEIIINTKAPYLLNQDTDLSSPAPELSTSQYQPRSHQPDHHVAEPARRLGLL